MSLREMVPGRSALGALLLLSAALAVGSASAPAAPQATASCVFSNPAFAGKCKETATVAAGSTEKQACEAILQCLNDVRCVKTYCQATTVLTGWTLESAKSSDSAR
jgi:hypothetical protein